MSSDENSPNFSTNERIAELLLPFLQEYTQRLQSEYVSYSRFRSISFLFQLGVVVAFFSNIFLAFRVDLRSPDAVDSYLNDQFAPYFLWFVLSTSGIVYAAYLAKIQGQRAGFVASCAARLEKLIRLCSALEDHSIADYGLRVRLQIRLADAEALLEMVLKAFNSKVEFAKNPNRLKLSKPRSMETIMPDDRPTRTRTAI